jgi:hypothetical protein
LNPSQPRDHHLPATQPVRAAPPPPTQRILEFVQPPPPQQQQEQQQEPEVENMEEMGEGEELHHDQINKVLKTAAQKQQQKSATTPRAVSPSPQNAPSQSSQQKLKDPAAAPPSWVKRSMECLDFPATQAIVEEDMLEGQPEQQQQHQEKEKTERQTEEKKKEKEKAPSPIVEDDDGVLY